MDEYIDDPYDNEQEEAEAWKGNPKKKGKKIAQNPKGPYTMEMVYRGTKFNITIENVSHDKFKTSAENEDTSNPPSESIIVGLKQYLENEGFYLAARKHNLYF